MIFEQDIRRHTTSRK